jgi:hypothetical protein
LESGRYALIQIIFLGKRRWVLEVKSSEDWDEVKPMPLQFNIPLQSGQEYE